MKDIFITIVGNNNVGKSSIFNLFTKSNDALVDSCKDTTIDSQYGIYFINQQKIMLIDTISYQLSLEKKIINNLNIAIKKSNLILFVVDNELGLTYHDINLSKYLHGFNKKILLVINKCENYKNIHTFWELGYKEIFFISIKKHIGIYKFKKYLYEYFLKNKIFYNDINYYVNKEKSLNTDYKTIKKIAVIGPPNVGKSTLVNAISKNTNPIVVNDKPGTTHNSVQVEIFYKKNNYYIIDTAGIFKINTNHTNYNKYQIFIKQTYTIINKSDLILLLLDATNYFSKKNDYILNYLFKTGKSFLLIVNKIDLIDLETIKKIKSHFCCLFKFFKNIKLLFISALYNNGIKYLVNYVNKINLLIKKTKINTSILNNIMKDAIENINKQNDFFINKKIKLKYTHIGGWNPIFIIIHGKNIHRLSYNYQSYFKNFFSKKLSIPGHQIKIYFKKTT